MLGIWESIFEPLGVDFSIWCRWGRKTVILTEHLHDNIIKNKTLANFGYYAPPPPALISKSWCSHAHFDSFVLKNWGVGVWVLGVRVRMKGVFRRQIRFPAFLFFG